MITKVGLDLGYANITLSNTPGDVYREPSVAVVDKNTRRVISVGSKAENSDTTACDGILVRPFLNGLLYSADLTKDIINHALAPINSVDKIRCVFAMPSDFVPKQENHCKPENTVSEIIALDGREYALSVARRFCEVEIKFIEDLK